MKSDCHGAEIRTIEINLVPFDGVCSTCGAACFAVTEECQPAEPRESNEDHPGRWPVTWCEMHTDSYPVNPREAMSATLWTDIQSARDYILHLEARAERAEQERGFFKDGCDKLTARAEAAEKERDELRDERDILIAELQVKEAALTEMGRECQLQMRIASERQEKLMRLSSAERDSKEWHAAMVQTEELLRAAEKERDALKKNANKRARANVNHADENEWLDRAMEAQVQLVEVTKERDELRDWLTSYKESFGLALKDNITLRERVKRLECSHIFGDGLVCKLCGFQEDE